MMVNQTVIFFILAIFGLWLIALSVYFYQILVHFRRLSKGIEGGNLLKLLDNLLEKEALNKKAIEDVKREVVRLEEEGRLHIQKLGFFRFNPFKELGGDHSFSLALLDGKDNGVLITGLHTRERTRVYVKGILRGKSKLELSKEEVRALKLAQKS